MGASAVGPLRRAFAAVFAARFPIRRMRLVDDYGGSDYASIQADNTSAFNCRTVTGGPGWSMHAYGFSIDINPIENPYVNTDGTTAHAASRSYLDRSNVREGMAVPYGALVRAFDSIGWGWGGRWPLAAADGLPAFLVERPLVQLSRLLGRVAESDVWSFGTSGWGQGESSGRVGSGQVAARTSEDNPRENRRGVCSGVRIADIRGQPP